MDSQEAHDAKYPEHVKLRGIADFSQKCFDFVDWMESEKGIRLCELIRGGDEFVQIFTPLRDLLAEFFGIDQTALENEKQAMLEELRNV